MRRSSGRAFYACRESTTLYLARMSTVPEIESAISQLSRDELSIFRDWFSKFDAAAWDQQFEEDVAGGRLDALADQAVQRI